jgi:hypothetical protein
MKVESIKHSDVNFIVSELQFGNGGIDKSRHLLCG